MKTLGIFILLFGCFLAQVNECEDQEETKNGECSLFLFKFGQF